MNDQRDSAESHWFGHDRLRLRDGERAVDVTVADRSHWDRAHLRRLRQSGDLPGMVPVIDSDFSADGKPFAVTPTIEAPSLSDLIDDGELAWTSGAAITEAAARAAHEAHLRGLFHGAMSPEDVYVLDGDVAVGGIGLGLGGLPPAERAPFTAPEVRDGGEATERSDVYSLGKILEQALGDDIDTTPRSIRRLMMWSSSDTPEARPPSAMEFASILAEGLGEDRETFGPAFISTGEVSDLAADASSAVTRHVPVVATASAEDDEDEDDSTSVGVAGVATAAVAGAAVAGVVASKTGDGTPSVPAEPIDDGFTVSSGGDGGDADGESELDDEPSVEEEPDGPEAETEVDGDDEGDEGDEGDVVDETDDDGDDEESVSALAGAASVPAVAAIDADEAFDGTAAAQTIDYEKPLVEPKRRNWAGLVIGGILLLGLAGIIYGLLTSGDDEDVATDSGTTTAAPTTAAPTTAAPTTAAPTTAAPTTAAPSTTATTAAPTTAPSTTATTAAPTTAAPTTAAPTTEAPTTTAGVEAADPAALVAQADGPITADDAAIQVLHGVPGAEVDVYVNGEAIAAGFTSGSIAGPVDLPNGDYDVQLFAAANPPAANAADRADEAIGSASVAVGGEPASVVAHLGEDGDVMISTFAEDLTELDPGQSRVVVRNLMAGGPVDVSVDGEIVEMIAPGAQTSIEREAAEPILVELVGEDGDVVASANVALSDGELASLSAIGFAEDGTAEIVAQRYSGLSTAPTAVPTGDSGLLEFGGDEAGVTLAYGLMIFMGIAGVGVALGRRRRLS